MRSSELSPWHLGRLLAPTLPLRPSPFGGPGVFGSTDRQTMWPMACPGPLALHLLFECPPSRATSGGVLVRTKPRRTLPRGTPMPYSMFPADSRFFSPSLEGVGRNLPFSSEVPLPGFGYPLRGFRSPALESLFHLSTLLGFSLQSFDPQTQHAGVSTQHFRS